MMTAPTSRTNKTCPVFPPFLLQPVREQKASTPFLLQATQRESRISTPFPIKEPEWSRTHPGTTTTVPTSTQVEDSPKTGDCLNSITFRYRVHRSRRIFGISWGPESGLHQVTPWRHETLPHQAAWEQLNTKAAASRHAGRVNRFLFFQKPLSLFFELKPRNLLIFEQVGKQDWFFISGIPIPEPVEQFASQKRKARLVAHF